MHLRRPVTAEPIDSDRHALNSTHKDALLLTASTVSMSMSVGFVLTCPWRSFCALIDIHLHLHDLHFYPFCSQFCREIIDSRLAAQSAFFLPKNIFHWIGFYLGTISFWLLNFSHHFISINFEMNFFPFFMMMIWWRN